MGRKFAPVLVLAALVGTLLVSTSARASVSSDESSFVSRINSARASYGLGAVSVRSDLVSVARSWSQHMADVGEISHDPNMPNEISGWTELGDNVGRGPDVASVHQAFMNSSEHRSIILHSAYNQVGVGVVWKGDTLYVTEVFVKRATSSTPKTVTHHRTTTTRTTTHRTVRRTSASSYIVVVLSDVITRVDFSGKPRSVTMLEQLVGLDARQVDPATGAPR
jgi:cysteine-rich secretory family protein